MRVESWWEVGDKEAKGRGGTGGEERGGGEGREENEGRRKRTIGGEGEGERKEGGG